MLTHLYVDNYRCLVNFQCQFGTKNLILGRNGAGKSTLFDVLMLLRDFCAHGAAPDDRLGESSRTFWQDVNEQTFELGVRGNEGDYKFRLLIDSWGNPARPRVVREEVFYSGQPIFRFAEGEVHLFNDRYEDKVQYPFDWHRSALATISERQDNTKLSWFKRWLSAVQCVRLNPWKMSAIAAQEETLPSLDLSNFANWYRHLRQEMGDHEYLEDLREVIEGFVTMRLMEAGERRREIMVKMQAGDADQRKLEIELGLNQLSDGQRVLIGLYALLHFALQPGVTICFDEPDNFISLREILPWLDRVLDRVEDNQTKAQALIVSHHPELLNRMALQDGLLLDRPGYRQTRVRPFAETPDFGLSPAELVTRGWDRE